MKFPDGFLMLIFFLFVVATPIAAQEQGPFQDDAMQAKAMVEAAYDFVLEHSNDMSRVQKALQTNPAFIDNEKELYIFIHCYNIEKKEAVCCGHGIRPELIGKNMWRLRTPNGRLLFHEIAQLVETEGEGWIEYDWLNPYTQSLQTKLSYVKGLLLKDGRTAWVGCGIWKAK